MNNYIVINGIRHDLMKRKGVRCQECSLYGYCTTSDMICAIFAKYNWDDMSDYYFVKHQNF